MSVRAQVRIKRDGHIVHTESVYGDDMYTVMNIEVAELCSFFEEDGICTSIVQINENNETHAWIRYYSEEYGFYIAKHLGRQC